MAAKSLVLESSFCMDRPFPYFGISKVFEDEFADNLLEWLRDDSKWTLTETSFYTQYEFSLLDTVLPNEISFLLEESTLDQMKELLRCNLAVPNLQLVGLTAHKLIDGHKMGVHNDFIGSRESHRLVIQLNSNWQSDNGGFLLLFNSKDPKDVANIVQPLHNSAVGFEISAKSFHAVSTVYNFERYTLVYTFNSVS